MIKFHQGQLLRVLLFLFLLVSCSSASSEQTVWFDNAPDVKIKVEVATTPEERQRGLMYRKELESDRGMLFVFPNAQPRSFWMKNTFVPLDIIYLSSTLSVVSIAKNARPHDENTYPSAGPAKYVLEVNGGFSDRHGLRRGSVLKGFTEK